jgi:hypothetical protein
MSWTRGFEVPGNNTVNEGVDFLPKRIFDESAKPRV